MNYVTHLVDAHRPAIDTADSTSLPMTVFYHPDWAYSHTNTEATILRDKQTKQFVTWLPSKYFA